MLTVCFYLGIRSGYFSGLKGYLKKISTKPYLGLFLMICALFFLALFFDLRVLKTLQGINHPLGVLADQLGGYLSKNTVLWITLSSLYFLSFIARHKLSSEILYGVLLATAFTGIVSQITKFIFVRARPYSDLGPFSFFNWDGMRKDMYQSLPSGDVALVAGASFLAFYSVRNLYLKAFLLILPLAAAFFRVVENKHWPSDTLVSIGIGMMVGFLVWDYKKIQV